MAKTYNYSNYIFSNSNLFVIIFTFLLVGCSVKSVKKLDNNKPIWISNAYNECEDGYVCSIGEGDNLNRAVSNARNEIAKYFSVNIKSTFNSLILQNNEKTDKSFSSAVNESVNDVINGIEIDKNYQGPEGKYYVLARLNKNKFANEIKKDIDEIDNKLKNLILERPVKYKTTEKLIEERSNKEKKYYFLTGNKVAEKVSKMDLINAKSEPTVYGLEINDNDNFGLKDIIVKQIVDNRDKVDHSSNRVIVGNVSLTKSYLRVAGFEKYLVDITIKCMKGKDTIGQLNIHVYETGRDKKQVISKVKNDIIKQISESRDKFLV